MPSCAGAMICPMVPDAALRAAYGEDARRTCAAVREQLEVQLLNPERGRKALELTLHGLKGAAAALEVGEGGALCHALEELLRTPPDWVPFPALLPALLQGVAELEQQAWAFAAAEPVPPVSSLQKSLMNQALGEGPFPPGAGRWPEALVESVDDDLEALFEAHQNAPPVPSEATDSLSVLEPYLRRQVEVVGEELGKAVAFEVALPALELPKARLSDLRTLLGHLLRNALDHGLEPPEARHLAGKAAQGLVRLEGEGGGSWLTLTLSDDGGGIDGETLSAKARAAGLVASEATLSLLDLLCLEGASVQDHASLHSGRGVGLAAVRQAVEGWGGALHVTTEAGQGTAFRLTVRLGS